MSVKGTNPKPQGRCSNFLGVPPGFPEELGQVQNSPKRLQTAETSSEQLKTSPGQPKAFPKCQNLAPKGSGPGFGPKRPFARIPEGNFNRRLKGAKLPKSASKRLLARIWPKKAPNCLNLLPKGSWPGCGPQRLFPTDPMRAFQQRGSNLALRFVRWKPTLALCAVCGAPTPPEQGGWPPDRPLTFYMGHSLTQIKAACSQGKDTHSMPQFGASRNQVRTSDRL